MDIINQASTQCQPVGEQLSFEGSGVPASVITVDRGAKKFKQAIQKDEDKKPITNCINVFFELFGIFAILRQCNIRARGHGGTGISHSAMFRFLFEQVFRDRSIYQLEKEGKLPEGVSTSSVSRFLAHKGYNWEKFLSVLGAKAVEYVQMLNDPGKVAGLAMDDTDYDRNPRKKQVDYCPGKPNKKKKKSRSDKGRRTELASKKYDHARHVHSKGYRMLTVIWTDATTVIPLAFCLLASMKDEKVCGSILNFAKKTLQYRRRKLARSKTTDVMVTLINRALQSVKATWIAADRWFSDPASILRIKNECKIDVITPLKHNKTKYEYNGSKMTIAQIHKALKKKRGVSRWFASATITMFVTEGKNVRSFNVKVVFVHNRAKRKEWIAFACTDTSLTEEQIIARYALRFDIEHMFRCIKYTLGLTSECHATSYDSIVAHTTIVLARYTFLMIEKRKQEDIRTMGELMYFISDQMEEMKLGKALLILGETVFDILDETLQLSEEQLELFISALMNKLPEYIKRALFCASCADPRDLDAIA